MTEIIEASRKLETRLRETFLAWSCKVESIGVFALPGLRNPVTRTAVKYHENPSKCGESAPRLYVLGRPLEEVIKRATYAFNIDGQVWYTAGWFPGEVNEHHPFGPMTLVFPWTCKDPIDMGDRWERKRYNATYTPLDNL